MEHPLTDTLRQKWMNELKDKPFLQSALKKLFRSNVYYELEEDGFQLFWIPIPKCSIARIKQLLERMKKLRQLYKWTHTLTIYLFPTSLKRYFPKRGMLQEKHINGGYTYLHQNTIYVYRLEECFKVILHELLHHSKHQIEWKPNEIQDLKSVMKLSPNYTFLPTEAVVEFWATVYHLRFIVEEQNIPFRQLYHEELAWSLSQTKRLLTYQKTYYPIWNELTNAMSYIYLKTCFLYFIQDFLPLTKNYSSSKLTQWLISHLTDPSFIKAIQSAEPASRSLRLMVWSDK